MSLLLAGAGSVTQAAQVKDAPDTVTVTTRQYEAVFSKGGGLTLQKLTDLSSKRSFRVQQDGLVVVEERERAEWAEVGFGQPTTHNESKTPATVSVQSAAESVKGAVLTGRWSNAAAEVVKTLTFTDDSPFFDVAYQINVKRPLEQIAYYLDVRDAAFSKQSRFFPGGADYIAREPREAKFALAPGYTYCHDGRSGVGLLALTPQSGVETLAHLRLSPGVWGVHLAAYTKPLRWESVPMDLDLRLSVAVGVEPEQVAAHYRKNNPALKPVEIAKLESDKLIFRTKEKGSARLTLRSNSETPQTVTVAGRLVGGIATERTLPEQKVTVDPLTDKEVRIEWDNKGEYGFALQAGLRDSNGAALDAASAYFAVTDHFVNVGQTTVWNAGWMKFDWLTPAMVEQAKDAHVGVIEYYCWAPDQVFDLTPDTEVFEPHTESQGVYRTELTRTFLKDMVKAAHEKGLYVNAMDTGMASLHGALARPERMKYTEDGQIYLYNGNIHDGRRFNAAPAHMYRPEYAKEWAEEMNRSVDMFGWDGVRFDWSFIPIAPVDPLHAVGGKEKEKNPYAEAAKVAWYDVNGKSAHDMFPDPDRTAADICSLYRKTVAAKHPGFIYNENYSVNQGMFQEYPKYSVVNCTDAGVLMESLLDVTRRYPTWQAWAEVLTDSLDWVRPCRGQPFVGWMRDYAPGGIAHRNLHFIMMASGFRWYGSYGPKYSIDDTYRRFRHATRFSEYFYDPSFVRQKGVEGKASLSGQGVDRILWQPFVFKRDRGQEGEVLVHLLNLPKDDHIIMHHEIPALKTDLVLRTSLGGNAQPQEAWLLIPEPEPHAEKLDLRAVAGQGAEVKIPRLESLGSVVIRFRRGG